MSRHLRVIQHADLSEVDIRLLRDFFNRQYFADFGPWNLDAPYGYSPADMHTLICDGPALVAHVGFQVRLIGVGSIDVSVAGTGGVLVDESCRGTGLGREVMQDAQQAMRNDGRVQFGYLGCREQVVPFYESTGWHRIHATEHHASRIDHHRVVTSTGDPLLIYPVRKDVTEWPPGDINLRGTPW
ncbi:GNAT family N-acetyltransferase [Citricoccus sp.]|uniref:GNAT family N-acetyltransferase n=1 Tax=Citricoccus sp. TaxID=1978372 RepID=UPI0028BD6FE4|nr:GNAT family N-acetyltransferase [Citricoccus sp.]